MSDQSIVYNSIGIGYNSTRCADPYLSERLYQLLNPESGKLYLDIGCGSGNYTLELAKRGIAFWGMDPSAIMLDEAKSKFSEINWLFGFAENIPLKDEQFDGAIATLTIHHWNNLEISFTEINRVLKPGSRLVIFTSTPEQMQGYWLNYYFPNMMTEANNKMPSLTKVENALNNAGMKIIVTEKYFVRDDLQDLFLYSCKNQPELCFDENIRNGISTFALQSNKDEVQNGLSNLRLDIDNNYLKAIKRQYENDFGDYLFIISET